MAWGSACRLPVARARHTARLTAPPLAPLPCLRLQSPSSPTAVQTISVPPEQLRKHAEANDCGVAALPAGALKLPPGTPYDDAVTLLVEAVERQWFEQLLAAASSSAATADKEKRRSARP